MAGIPVSPTIDRKIRGIADEIVVTAANPVSYAKKAGPVYGSGFFDRLP